MEQHPPKKSKKGIFRARNVVLAGFLALCTPTLIIPWCIERWLLWNDYFVMESQALKYMLETHELKKSTGELHSEIEKITILGFWEYRLGLQKTELSQARAEKISLGSGLSKQNYMFDVYVVDPFLSSFGQYHRYFHKDKKVFQIIPGYYDVGYTLGFYFPEANAFVPKD